MIVWIASYPRSGSTFCRLVVNRLYGFQSKGIEDPRTKWTSPVHALGIIQINDLSIEEMEETDELYFLKTHNLQQLGGAPAFYLLRDARDSLISYAHYVKDVLDNDNSAGDLHTVLRNLILEKRSPYGRWSDNADHWTNRANTAVIRFEDLIASPRQQVISAVEALGLNLPPPSDTGIEAFAKLHSTAPLIFRSGNPGGWRDEFPAELLDLFYNEQGDALRRHGYMD